MRQYLKDLKDLAQVEERLETGQEYIATKRVTGVADGADAINAAIVNPAGSGVNVFVDVTFATGGRAYLSIGESASIDTSGTDLTHQAKGVDNGKNLTAETGGTYTSSNPLESLIPGTARAGGPVTSRGSTTIAPVRLLEPGDGLEYTLTNQSGGSADFSINLDWVEESIE
jgi:hypothetical protein